MQHEAADLLAGGDVVRFQAVEDALARRGVGNVFAAGQRRAQRAALRRVFALGLEKERMMPPDVAAAAGAECLVYLGDFRGWRDRIADNPAADVPHDMGNRAIAVDNGVYARILRSRFRFPLVCRGTGPAGDGSCDRVHVSTPMDFRNSGTERSRRPLPAVAAGFSPGKDQAAAVRTASSRAPAWRDPSSSFHRSRADPIITAPRTSIVVEMKPLKRLYPFAAGFR